MITLYALFALSYHVMLFFSGMFINIGNDNEWNLSFHLFLNDVIVIKEQESFYLSFNDKCYGPYTALYGVSM